MLLVFEWWPITAWAIHIVVALALLRCIDRLNLRTAACVLAVCAVPLVNTVLVVGLVALVAVRAIKEIL